MTITVNDYYQSGYSYERTAPEGSDFAEGFEGPALASDPAARDGWAWVTGDGDVWETYPRVSSLRHFPRPDWAENHADRVPEQPWLDARRAARSR